MLLNLERHWYKRSYSWLTYLLLPLSGIFSLIITCRRFLYRIGLKKTIHFPVPVIVVGNIVVGGTGKTPLVIWLTKFLRAAGYKPGIVSRGVGGIKHKVPQYIDETSQSAIVGDEAVLLAKKTHCPVVICVDRAAAVKELLAKSCCNIVIADDGLQHYRLGRTIEIAVIDGERQFGNGCLLPAGPLRELPSRLKTVNCIVTHGQTGAITMQLKGWELRGMITEHKRSMTDLISQTVHAVAGIGNPQRFFNFLRSQGLLLIEHVFPDHYQYKKKDFHFSDDKLIIMTEKDAVKCQAFADERFLYMPVEAIVDDQLQHILLQKLADFPANK
ncbi:MAG: tetraacyldisaccharide 4'-kinase [Gammaproteobacteria bacterium]|nr:tetraacyldisaccharide 4'-kinase [Gammaproteobacteria bacterium]